MNQEEGWLQARREHDRARRRRETSEDHKIRLQRRRECDQERSEQETPVHRQGLGGNVHEIEGSKKVLIHMKAGYKLGKRVLV